MKDAAMLSQIFQIASGSVPGTDHTLPGQPGWINNQDACRIISSPHCIVALVCDGCSSGKHSEVGAHIGANILAKTLSDHGERHAEQLRVHHDVGLSFPLERVRKQVLAHIHVLTTAMGGSLSKTINDYFLFTVVGAVITPGETYIFTLGDGIYILNGRQVIVSSPQDNIPPYMAYDITGSSLTDTHPELLKFQLQEIIATAELQSLLIATDGAKDLIKAREQSIPGRQVIVGPISQFWEDDKYFRNSDNVRRQLAQINRERAVSAMGRTNILKGLLPDDTTLCVVRRTPLDPLNSKDRAHGNDLHQ